MNYLFRRLSDALLFFVGLRDEGSFPQPNMDIIRVAAKPNIAKRTAVDRIEEKIEFSLVPSVV
tara:strand:- start:40 stop:228 length:189 start_codon:yes stop_codon:yes gene_type:complete